MEVFHYDIMIVFYIYVTTLQSKFTIENCLTHHHRYYVTKKVRSQEHDALRKQLADMEVLKIENCSRKYSEIATFNTCTYPHVG